MVLQVFLVSTRAGGTGLNLTAANWAFMMDLWWNAAIDYQAMDRIHRLGQTRPVRIMRFVADGTIDEPMLALQESKAAKCKGALTKLSAEEARALRASSIRTLFQEV